MQILVYPNPSRDFIVISGLLEKEKYEIYDFIGKTLLNGVVSDGENLSIKNFNHGVYFIKFENKNALKFVKK